MLPSKRFVSAQWGRLPKALVELECRPGISCVIQLQTDRENCMYMCKCAWRGDDGWADGWMGEWVGGGWWVDSWLSGGLGGYSLVNNESSVLFKTI